MVRAGRIFTGAAFHDLAHHSFAAQGSLSYGWYDENTFSPWFEVEIGATIDSGMFNGDQGDPWKNAFGLLRSVPTHLLSKHGTINLIVKTSAQPMEPKS